jgi:hypothetical protein
MKADGTPSTPLDVNSIPSWHLGLAAEPILYVVSLLASSRKKLDQRIRNSFTVSLANRVSRPPGLGRNSTSSTQRQNSVEISSSICRVFAALDVVLVPRCFGLYSSTPQPLHPVLPFESRHHGPGHLLMRESLVPFGRPVRTICSRLRLDAS